MVSSLLEPPVETLIFAIFGGDPMSMVLGRLL